MIDESMIFAYIDGELEGEERARVQRAIEADPALQAMVAEHHGLAERMRDAFGTVLDEPVPASLWPVERPAADIVSFAQARSRRDRLRGSWGFAQLGAMAATLIAGLVGGAFFTLGHGDPVVEKDGALVASGQLERALNAQLASAQGERPSVRIGLTFRNHDGQICRSFSARSAEGVACRDGSSWRMQGLLAPESGQAGEYRTAASPATADLIDRLIEGDALDQQQERAAKEANWAAGEKSENIPQH